MSFIPKSWFSNPRPLPLDDNGKVDFSKETACADTSQAQEFNPLTAERFMGRVFHKVIMPDSSRIIVLYRWDSNDKSLSLYNENHNVFKLDKDDNIIWQVQRDDSNMNPDWWENMHQLARADGYDGKRAPFRDFMLEYEDGSNNRNEIEALPDEAIWVLGCKIWLIGSMGRRYLLDPVTGIAKNMTDGLTSHWLD